MNFQCNDKIFFIDTSLLIQILWITSDVFDAISVILVLIKNDAT